MAFNLCDGSKARNIPEGFYEFEKEAFFWNLKTWFLFSFNFLS